MDTKNEQELSFPDKIFKIYDIRGVYPEQLNEKLIKKIGQSYVLFLKSQYPDKEKLKIVVGRDMRVSSPSLMKSLCEGIISMGADVIDIGLSSTPVFYFAVGKYNYDGGMQVSASHNPKEYNGIKLVKRKAYPIGLLTGLDIIRDTCKGPINESESKGEIIKLEGVLDEYIEYSMNFIDIKDFKNFKVVCDTANSMGSLELEAFFKKTSMNLVKMNFELDGTFPAHQPDPLVEENLTDIKAKVIGKKADLGIATDGDSDRIFFIDNNGKLIEPGIVRGILSKDILITNPGATICYDIRPGKITKDMIEENGGKPFVTKVGHSLIKADAIQQDSPFAGESSGHFFYKTDYGTFEMPIITAQVILKQMLEQNKPISEIVEPLNRYYHTGEINSKVKDKDIVFDLIKKIYKKTANDIILLDGVTVEFDDWWFNVRGSNTEPLIRLNLEAKDKETMLNKRDEVLELIRSN